jgi:hypothetical protein
MKYLISLLACALIAGCGDQNPTGPSYPGIYKGSRSIDGAVGTVILNLTSSAYDMQGIIAVDNIALTVIKETGLATLSGTVLTLSPTLCQELDSSGSLSPSTCGSPSHYILSGNTLTSDNDGTVLTK